MLGSTATGMKDDSYLLDCMLESFQASVEPHWYVAGHELAGVMIAHLHDTDDDRETLLTRPRDRHLWQCHTYRQRYGRHHPLKHPGFTGNSRYVEIAHQALAQMQSIMAEHPPGFG